MDFEFIYKICTKDEWIKAKNEGRFLGSVKESNVSSAAGIAFDPMEYKIKPKQTSIP